jgi:hypothetical protein
MLSHLSLRRKTMTHTLPQTTDNPKPPYTPRAMYATYLGNWGTALRTAEGRVFF